VIAMLSTVIKPLLANIFLLGFATVVTASPYAGIYRGTFSLSDLGLYGICVGHVDSKGQASLWLGNSDEAYKFSFKVNASGLGQFTSDGVRFSLHFQDDGSISISNSAGFDLSLSSTKVTNIDRPGTQQLYSSLRTKATNSISLDFPSDYEQPDFNFEELEDGLLLMSGVWQINSAKANIGGTRVTMTGDMIILPDAIYTFGKAKGTQILVEQDPYAFDYGSFQLNSALLNWPKKQLSAQGSGYVQGYYGTIDYTVTQKNSHYDSDVDGLSNYVEITETLTDPFKADTDGDKVGDADEIAAGTDPLDRLEFPAKLTIAISTAKGANVPTSTTVSINGIEHQVALNKGKGTLVLSMPSGASYQISASSPNWSSGSPQTISLKKTTTLRIQIKPAA
jgi:hypothetical protein